MHAPNRCVRNACNMHNAHAHAQALKTTEMELEMSLKRKTGAEQEARLARQEVEGLTQARDW